MYRCTSEVVTKYIQDMKTVEEEYYSYFTGKCTKVILHLWAMNIIMEKSVSMIILVIEY